jgi:hypothetical protein
MGVYYIDIAITDVAVFVKEMKRDADLTSAKEAGKDLTSAKEAGKDLTSSKAAVTSSSGQSNTESKQERSSNMIQRIAIGKIVMHGSNMIQRIAIGKIVMYGVLQQSGGLVWVSL